MRYGLFIVVSGVLLTGCVTLPPAKKTVPEQTSPISAEPTTALAQRPAPAEEPQVAEPVPMQNGIIFGKTNFKGVLKTNYVKLSMVDVNDPQKKYYLYIGDSLRSFLFPWNTKSVEPGYFFLEFPAGTYKIYSISIPLGSALATEKIDITFTAQSDEINYIGTLEVVGIGEKVKFGGVPIIIPGFDYYFDILDEREEALKEFRNRYPLIQKSITVNLMQDMRSQGKFDSAPY